MSEHWEPVIPYTYRRGALIQRDSGDCGRWVNFDPSVDWICEECSKYYKQKFEATKDGITWYDTGLRRKGGLYEIESDDCCLYRWVTLPISQYYECDECEIQPTGLKWIAEYNYGITASAACDSTSAITESELRSVYNNNLNDIKNLIIGDCVKTIWHYCHDNDGFRALTNVTIGNNVETIGSCFFDLSSIRTINIPRSVKTIDSGAFKRCYELINITIPDSVTSIGWSAFNSCNGITGITFEAATPPTLGSGALTSTNDCPIFVPCSSVNTYKTAWSVYADRITCSSEKTLVRFILNDGNVDEFKSAKSDLNTKFYAAYSENCIGVEVTTACTSIGYSAFSECSFSGVAIPSTVATIGDRAFYYCRNLINVFIPDSVTSIGEEAFAGCYSLSSATIGNGVTTIGGSAFLNCSGLTTCSIGRNVTNIGDFAFYNCSGLTSVNIPDSVTQLGRGAFEECFALTSITLPDSVTTIGGEAFAYCSGLTNVTIGNGVTSIGGSAFYDCNGITSITIPSGVTSIGTGAFSGCTSLTSVTIDSNSFVSDRYYGSQVKEYIIGDSVTSIGFDTFDNCSGLTSVTIGNGVTSIGARAFKNCSNLRDLTIGSAVTTIENEAFHGCSSLTSISIPDSVTELEVAVFARCSGLTSVTIGSGITSIGVQTFYGCSGLTSIVIPNSVTSINFETFRNCSGLTSCTIGSGVTEIGKNAFWNCTSLDSITIDAITPPTLGSGVFYGTRLTNFNGHIYVPSSSVNAYKEASGWSNYSGIIQAKP